MKNANKSLIIIATILLLLPFTLANPQLIEEARTNTPEWETGISVEVDELYEYQSTIYKVVQAHTTQTGWEPPTVPALFTEHTFQNLGEISVYSQPTGAQDAYNQGDNVLVNDVIYESLQDANVWKPTEEPTLWNKTGTLEDLNNQVTPLQSGNIYYNEHASINTLNGTTPNNIELGDKAVSADSGNGTYEITVYTGNDDVTYGIRNDETNDYKEATSQDGYVTFTVNHFSTWTAGFPDVTINLDEGERINLDSQISDISQVDQVRATFYDCDGCTTSGDRITFDDDTGTSQDYLEISDPASTSESAWFEEDYFGSELFWNAGTSPEILFLDVGTDYGFVTNAVEDIYTVELRLFEGIDTDTETFTVTVEDDTTPPPSGTCNDLETCTLSYYTLDENTGTTAGDSTPNGNDGTITGATWTSGILNSALDFSGTGDYVSFPSSLIGDWRSGTYTISGWVNYDSLDNIFAVIYGEGDSTDNNDFAWFAIDDNTVSGSPRAVLTMRDTGSTEEVRIASTDTIPSGTWTHVAITVDGNLVTNSKVYVNGVEGTSVEKSGSDTSPTVDNYNLGAINRDGVIKFEFDGRQDELGIFDETLSSTQINYLYNSGSPDEEQQYDYTPTEINPTLDNPIPDHEATTNVQKNDGTVAADALITPSGQGEYRLTDYFSGYEDGDELTITYQDENDQEETHTYAIDSSTGNSDQGSGTGVYSFISGGSNPEFYFIIDYDLAYNYNDPITVEVCESGGNNCVDDTFTVEVLQYTQAITDKVDGLNSQTTINLNDYYEGNTETQVQLEDSQGNIIEGYSNSITYTSTELDLTFDGLASPANLVLDSKSDEESYVVRHRGIMNTQVSEDEFDYTIEDDLVVTQEANVADITQDYDEVTSNNFDTYFTNHNEVAINFDHEGASQELNSYGGSTTYTSSEFDVTLDATTYEVTWESKTTDVSPITVTYTASRTGANSLSTNFEYSIQDSNPVTVSSTPTRDLTIELEETIDFTAIGDTGDNITDYFEEEEYYLVRYAGEEIFLTDQYLVVLESGTTYTGLNDNLEVSTTSGEPEATDTVTGNSWNFADLELRIALYPEFTGVDEDYDNDVFVQSTNAGNYTIEVVGYQGSYDETTQTVDIESEASRNVNVNVYEEGEQPTNGGGGVSEGEASEYFWNTLLGIFPDEEGLSTGQKLGISAFLLMLILGFGAYAGSRSPTGSGLVNIVTAGAGVVAIFFLTGIGYIPVWVTGVLVIGVVFFIVSRTTSIGLGGA